MRLLLAFDKFKDALSAEDACAVATEALREIHPQWQFDSCPLTDGGEGFTAILTRAADGRLASHTVRGPRGTPVAASIGFVAVNKIPAAARARLGLPPNARDDAEVAIIEMAAASGLALLPRTLRDPWQASTFGTGELMRAAAQAGAAAILLGVGGSATNDLGLGALRALGLEFRSSRGASIDPVPANWKDIACIAGATAASLPPIRIACDVTNPLLGPQGCATIYGPQKGLARADIARLENESARLALTLCHHRGRPDTLMDVPGAGAAGGIAFGLMAGAEAALLPGFDLVAEWLDLERRIAAADVVLTGEGRFDESSLRGKGPGAIVARARTLGRAIHVFAGAVTAAPRGDVAMHTISPPDLPLEKALLATADLLRAAVRREFSRSR